MWLWLSLSQCSPCLTVNKIHFSFGITVIMIVKCFCHKHTNTNAIIIISIDLQYPNTQIIYIMHESNNIAY